MHKSLRLLILPVVITMGAACGPEYHQTTGTDTSTSAIVYSPTSIVVPLGSMVPVSDDVFIQPANLQVANGSAFIAKAVTDTTVAQWNDSLSSVVGVGVGSTALRMSYHDAAHNVDDTASIPITVH